MPRSISARRSSHAAFAADRAVAALAGRLVLHRGQPGGAVELPGAGPAGRVTDRGAVVAGPDHAPAGHGGQRRERAGRQQLGQLGSRRRRSGSSRLGQQRQVGGQHLPGDRSVRGRQRVPGGGDQPLGDRPADPQPAGGGEPDEPGHPQRRRAGRVGELGRRPADRPWCPTRPAAPTSTRGSSGPADPAAGSSSRSGSPPGGAGAPPTPLSSPISRRRLGDRDAAAGQHQLGDRLQIDRVGLHPPPTLHPPLLADMRRVQLQHLPAAATPMASATAGGNDQPPPPRPGSPRARQPQPRACSITRPTPGAVIAKLDRAEQPMPSRSVTDNAAVVLPTSTATTTAAGTSAT